MPKHGAFCVSIVGCSSRIHRRVSSQGTAPRERANFGMVLEHRALVNRSQKRGNLHMWNPLRERERRLHTLYPNMPPRALLVQHLGKKISVDGAELQRAQWFWGRRPRKLILSIDRAVWIVTFYLLLWTTSLFDNGHAQATAVVWAVAWVALAAIAVAVFVDISRYAQWKWEYCCAISRLFATANR